MKNIVLALIILFSSQALPAAEIIRTPVQGFEASVPPRSKMEKRIKKQNKKKKKKGDTTCPKIDC